jgi:hypothetical protein
MKKLIVAIGVLTLLAAGTAAYAHMSGWGGGYGPGYGHMYGGGPGYGHMYGGGPGYGHMGPGYGQMWQGDSEEGKKFLEETADIRRELHEKRFDLREAYRTGDEEKAEAIEKEVEELRDQLAEKGGFDKDARRGTGRGYGPRAGGYGYCGGPYGR